MSKLNNIWKNRLITILGFLVLVMPLLGFPHGWSDTFYFVIGLAIMILSFQLGRYLVYGDEELVVEQGMIEVGKTAEKPAEKPKTKSERKHKIPEPPVIPETHENEKPQ